MIFSIVGTKKEIKDKAIIELQTHGPVSQYLYSEHIGDLERLIDSSDLFGGKVIVNLVSLLDSVVSKETVLDLLPKMKDSPNIFIIDEPFADVHKVNKLAKVSSKLYDAREEKKKDSSVFVLCLSFAKRDKKSAWLDYMDLRGKESGEALQGALWWKWREVWQDTLTGKKTAYTLLECESIGKEILLASILAHRGERDIDVELERVILSI